VLIPALIRLFGARRVTSPVGAEAAS
jgi:hypothetical protein